MASSPIKPISLLLILSLLCIQIHARESHFFSKVPNNGDNFDTKESRIPNKVVDPLTNPQDQQPNFIPQTQDNGYGLYGHESGQLPPNSDEKFSDPMAYDNNNNYRKNDVVAYKSESGEYYDNNNNYRRNDAVPYKSESEEEYNNNNYNKNENFQNGKPYENSFYYNKDLYDNGQQSFTNTRLSRDDFTTSTTTTPLYDQEKYHDNNVVRQGMSDTRFMENGKYYYDLNREPHHYSNSRGNFGNNNNNGNTFQYGANSMGRFQNDEAEFQEGPDEFVP